MFLFPFHFLSAERQEKLINKILKVGPIFQLVCAVWRRPIQIFILSPAARQPFLNVLNLRKINLSRITHHG